MKIGRNEKLMGGRVIMSTMGILNNESDSYFGNPVFYDLWD